MKTEDLAIGDNDNFSAKVAVGLRADKLIILTNQNGLHTRNPDYHKNAKLIKKVVKIDSKSRTFVLQTSPRLAEEECFQKFKRQNTQHITGWKHS